MTWIRKIAVVGSKRGVDPEVVRDFVGKMDTASNVLITTVATGVDRVAQEAAMERGIRTVIIRPNFKKYQDSALRRADHEAVEAAHDVVVFAEFGKDGRWERLIEYAIELQRPLAVFTGAGTLVRSIQTYDE